MKRIFILNSKGGCGKTTIANELAYSFERTRTSYSYFNLDPQGGSPHEESLSDTAVVAVADAPGHYDKEEMIRCAKAADLVIIPVRSSNLDAHAFIGTYNLVRSINPDIPIIVVQNAWNHYRAAKSFREDFLNKEVAEGTPIMPLAQSDMIIQAQAMSKSVLERAPRSKAASHILQIVNAARKAVGLPEDTGRLRKQSNT